MAQERQTRLCGALTRKGGQCRRPVTKGGTACWAHSTAGKLRERPPDRERCEATTKEGLRCRRWAATGTSLCTIHAKGYRGSEEDDRRRCVADTKSGAPCANWAMEGAGGLRATHAAVAGFEEGKPISWTNDYYAQRMLPDEVPYSLQERATVLDGRLSLQGEIALCRWMVGLLLEHAQPTKASPNEMLEIVETIFKGTKVITFLVAEEQLLNGGQEELELDWWYEVATALTDEEQQAVGEGRLVPIWESPVLILPGEKLESVTERELRERYLKRLEQSSGP